MADFSKEFESIKELLTDVFNKGVECGKREGHQKAFDRGQAYRHKRLEEKGLSFNVGDTVCTTVDYDWAGAKVFACGTVGTIVEKHMSKLYNIMLYEVKSEDGLNSYLYGAADLELVKPAETKAPVKVGSIVKIVKEYNDYNLDCHLFDKGTLAVITGIKNYCPEHSTDGTYKYTIQTPDGITFYYDRDGFEVVTRVEEDK